MAITFDPAKRAITLLERSLDFADAELVFAGSTATTEDARLPMANVVIARPVLFKADLL